MAATPAATRLTEAHRLAQARLGRQVAAEMLAIWPLLDARDLDGTFDRWVRAALPLLTARNRRSASLAANYLSTFKMLELGTPSEVALAPMVEAARLKSSLLVTGPASIRANTSKGMTLEKATETARVTSARSAMRHAMAGGRDTTNLAIERDPQIVGYARVASGSACSFCAMLASRGPVYLSKQSGSVVTGRRGGDIRGTRSAGADFHDGCGCSVEPVYRTDTAWPPNSDRYKAQWDQAQNLARDEDIRTDVAFRRLHEGRPQDRRRSVPDAMSGT